MTRIDILPEQRDFIRARVEHFDTDAPENLRWQADQVRAHRALPLFIGWTETIGIRADGTLVRWSTEGEWDGARELEDRTSVNVALVEGSRRYPELRSLVPVRPQSARTCADCGGSGTVAALPDQTANIICSCGGLGWIPG